LLDVWSSAARDSKLNYAANTLYCTSFFPLFFHLEQRHSIDNISSGQQPQNDATQNDTTTKWHSEAMQQRKNTETKEHSSEMTQQQNDTIQQKTTQQQNSTATKWRNDTTTNKVT
jgi:hypothetical protein